MKVTRAMVSVPPFHLSYEQSEILPFREVRKKYQSFGRTISFIWIGMSLLDGLNIQLMWHIFFSLEN